MNSLQKLLKTVDPKDQDKLDAYWRKMPAGDRLNILWYPSSGFDFRDLFETTTGQRHRRSISDNPHVFIHTDYARVPSECDTLDGGDDRTKYKVVETLPLALVDQQSINYYVNKDYVLGQELGSPTPQIVLLTVDV